MYNFKQNAQGNSPKNAGVLKCSNFVKCFAMYLLLAWRYRCEKMLKVKIPLLPAVEKFK